MRFLIIDTDYPSFLHWLYTQDPSLKHKTYEKQCRFERRVSSLVECLIPAISGNLVMRRITSFSIMKPCRRHGHGNMGCKSIHDGSFG